MCESDSMNDLGVGSFYPSVLISWAFFAGQPDDIELILVTWAQNISKKLPILAFFYLEEELASVQFDQNVFFNSTDDKIVPIIKINLPRAGNADAQFIDNQADQVR